MDRVEMPDDWTDRQAGGLPTRPSGQTVRGIVKTTARRDCGQIKSCAK